MSRECMQLWHGTTDNTHLNITFHSRRTGEIELYKRSKSYSITGEGDFCFSHFFSPPTNVNDQQSSDYK